MPIPGFSGLGASGGIDIKFLGFRRLEKNLEKFFKATVAGTEKGIDLVSVDLLRRSSDLCPILYGWLIESGDIHRERRGKKKAKNIVHYGGGTRTSSTLIHESPSVYVRWIHFARYRLGPISRLKPATEDGPVGRMFLHRPFEKHRKRYSKFITTFAKKSGEKGKLRFTGTARI